MTSLYLVLRVEKGRNEVPMEVRALRRQVI